MTGHIPRMDTIKVICLIAKQIPKELGSDVLQSGGLCHETSSWTGLDDNCREHSDLEGVGRPLPRRGLNRLEERRDLGRVPYSYQF